MLADIINITRMYALPMTVMSWFVAFCYSVKSDGNILYGFIALFGIIFVHLGVNTFDDVVDFITLPKTKDSNGKLILLNAQNGKCQYLIDKKITLFQMGLLSGIFFLFAALIGIFFILNVSFNILWFIISGGILCILYPFLGKFRLCEIALSLIYGPVLFGGINYVMCGHYDFYTLIICIPTMFFTLNLLYTDMMMDYEIDKNEGKKTIPTIFSTNIAGLRLQKLIILMGYSGIIVCYLLKLCSWWVFLTFLTIPMSINLINSMKIFINNKDFIPRKNFLDGITENWESIINEGSQSFMLRMYQARNLMICISILFGSTILL